MADELPIQHLEAMIRDLHARLSKVENGNMVVPAKETIYGRMDRERDERAQRIQDKNSSKPQDTPMSASRPINQKRWDEMRHRNHQLNAPAVNKDGPKVVSPQFTDVRFTCWYKNKIALITLKAAAPANPLPQ
jgi:hypothetical protein